MKPLNVNLHPLQVEDREQFITDNQQAFKYGATEEFGLRDDHFEEDGQIISRSTIEACLDQTNSIAYRIYLEEQCVGGVVLSIHPETNHNALELLFISPTAHSKGIGQAAWKAVEALYPDTVVWETCTPYFEKRNIHFYVNRCGFHIVEFFNAFHRDPHEPDNTPATDGDEFDGMFRFEKWMNR